MKKIERVEIDGQQIYLKKNFDGWKIVYPYKPEYNNGKINWKHLIAGSSWFNLLKIGFIVLIILGCIYEYTHVLKVASDCLSQPNILGELII